MGINPMNKITIIIRILFAVTLFQQKSSSITIAQDMVSWGGEMRSIYTWRGKPTSLGSKPSVHHQANE
jgi:hypothetical protein